MVLLMQPKFLSDIMYAVGCTPSLLLSTSEGEGQSFLFKEVNQDSCWTFNFITTTRLIVPPMILCMHSAEAHSPGCKIPSSAWLHGVGLSPLWPAMIMRCLLRKAVGMGYIWLSCIPHFSFFWMSSHSISCHLYLVTVFLSVIAAV